MSLLRRTSLTAFLLASSLLIAHSASAQACKQPKGKPILIGELNTYSGPATVMTEPYRKGVEMAVEEVNCAGGVMDRPLKVIFRDDKGSAEEARKIAQDFHLKDKVDIIAGGMNTVFAVTEYAKKNKILFSFQPGTQIDAVYKDFHPYIMHFGTQHTQYIRAIGTVVGKTWDAKRWVALIPDDAYGRYSYAEFKQTVQKYNPKAEFVEEMWIKLFTEMEFTPYITKIMSLKPDAIWGNIWGGQNIAFIKQAQPYGLFKKFKFASNSVGTPEELMGLGKDAPVGAIAFGIPWYDPKIQKEYPKLKEWAERHIKRVGYAPTWGSQFGYGGIMQLADLLKRAGSVEPDKVIAAMSKDYETEMPWGKVFFRACDHQSYFDQFVGQVNVNAKGEAILENITVVKGRDMAYSCEAIEKIRKEKKGSIPAIASAN